MQLYSGRDELHVNAVVCGAVQQLGQEKKAEILLNTALAFIENGLKVPGLSEEELCWREVIFRN